MILALVAVAAAPASAAKIPFLDLNTSLARAETTALIPLTIADAGEAETEDGLLPYRHVVRRQEGKVRRAGGRR